MARRNAEDGSGTGVSNAALGLVPPKSSMSLIDLAGERWVYSESLSQGHFTNDPADYARHSHASKWPPDSPASSRCVTARSLPAVRWLS